MDFENVFQIGFAVLGILGILAALAASQTSPAFTENRVHTRESRQAFHEQLAADPGWPAKEKFSKDMARYRHDSAYTMRLGPAETAEELRAA